MNKRKVLALALAVCIIAILACGTLAYFTDSENVTNKFYTASYKPDDPVPDPDELFSIKLDETDITKDDNSRTESGNTYAGILPGDELIKDPTVTNTGMYDAWVRVKVTVTDAQAWTDACAKHGITDLSYIFRGFDASAWDREIDEDEIDLVNDTITYTYYYNDTVAPDGTAKLFDSIIIPEEFDVSDMASLATFQLHVVGEAIQATNTGDTAQEAFLLWE